MRFEADAMRSSVRANRFRVTERHLAAKRSDLAVEKSGFVADE
jgi:hypothetical protein